MNKTIIFDKDLISNIDKINLTDELKNSLTSFEEVDDVFFNDLLKDMQIFVIAKVEMFFISSKFLNFIKSLDEIKKDLEVKVIFVNYENDNNIILKWFEQINKKYNLKFEVISQQSKSDFEKILITDFESLFNLSAVQMNFLSDSCKTDGGKDNINKLDERFNVLADILNQELSKDKNFVTIYTDGACSGNPGAGGWGAVLISGDRKKEISGFDESTTNNRMELTAVIEALLLLKQRCNVELYSDSAYVVNAINQNWLDNWKKNGWKGSDKKPVKNIELWQELDYLLNVHNVKFNKVKGHSDNELNNRCDELATGEIAKNTII